MPVVLAPSQKERNLQSLTKRNGQRGLEVISSRNQRTFY